MSDWTVSDGAIVGRSPISLPPLCVECGRDAIHGERVETTLYWYPRWIWIGLLWGVLPAILLYYAARRSLEITYSLCPEHQRTLAAKRRIVLGMWCVFAIVSIAAITTSLNSYLMFAAAILLLVTLFTHMVAGLALRVTRSENGVFEVHGFGKGFLSFHADPT